MSTDLKELQVEVSKYRTTFQEFKGFSRSELDSSLKTMKTDNASKFKEIVSYLQQL